MEWNTPGLRHSASETPTITVVLLLALGVQLLGYAGLILFHDASRLANLPKTVFVLTCGSLAVIAFVDSRRISERPSANPFPVRFGLGVVCAALFVTPPLLELVNGDDLSAKLAPVSSAARWGLPLTLALRCFSCGRRGEQVFFALFAAMTFVGHGVSALVGKTEFVFLIRQSAARFDLRTPSIEVSQAALTVIGLLDLIAATVVVIGVSSSWACSRPKRPSHTSPRQALPIRFGHAVYRSALGYLIVWASVTAFSRVTAGGIEHVPDVFFRASHMALPALLWLGRRPLPAPDWDPTSFGQRSHRRD